MLKKLIILLASLLYAQTIYSAGDLCYGNIQESGDCSGALNAKCIKMMDIINISQNPTSDITINYNDDSFVSIGTDCGVIPDSEGQCEGGGIFNPFGSEVTYTLNPTLSHDDKVTIWYSVLGSLNFFNGNYFTVSYDKDGITYTGRLYACPTPTDTTPSPAVTSRCNTFTNVLQTRSDNALIYDGNSRPKTLSYIHDSPNCILNSTYVYNDGTHGLKCDNGEFAIASGMTAPSINVNYTYNATNTSVDDSPTTSTRKITISRDEKLYYPEYKEIDMDYNGGYEVKLPENATKKINKLTNNNSDYIFEYNANHDIDIGIIETNGDSKIAKFEFTDIPDNINIYKIDAKSAIQGEFIANKAINIEELDPAKYSTYIVLKAPEVNINDLSFKEYGSGNATVVIYADNINIYNIDMAQNSKLIIHPYSTDKPLTFNANNITTSSSSQMIVDSGNYYVKSFEIKDSGNGSVIKASKIDQKVYLITESLDLGSENAINSDSVNDFGSNPAGNFLIFVHHDLTTGGGGCRINALVYVEDDVTLGSPTYVKGAISSNGDIVIGNGSHFYWDDSANDSGFGRCSGTSATTGGIFNVVEPSFNSTIDPIDDAQNNIQTKRVNQIFQMKVLKLGDDNETLTSYNGIISTDIIQDPQDDPNKCQTNPTIGNSDRYVIFNGESEKLFSTSSNQPIQKARFRIRYLSDGEGIIKDNDNDCSTKTYKCAWGLLGIIGQNKYGSSCPNNSANIYCDMTCADKCDYKKNKDNTKENDTATADCWNCLFANYSKSVCSRDNFAIRPKAFSISPIHSKLIAGKEYNITIQAIDENNNTIPTFNATEPVKLEISDVKKCLTDFNALPTTLEFKNGVATLPLTYNEVGDINLTISEVKNSSEYAAVDEKDTTDDNLLISSDSAIISEFIPKEFKIDASFKGIDSAPFVYISNDMNMSGHLDINITAINANNKTLKNYNSKCYARNFDLNISYAPIDTTNIKNLTNLNYEINSTAYPSLAPNNQISVSLSKDYFKNGMGEIPVKLNFAKDYRHYIKEFNLTINDITIIDANQTKGEFTTPLTLSYRYGRLKFANVVSYNANAKAKVIYEYFTNEGWKQNTLHTNKDFGTILGFYPPASVDNVDINISAPIKNGVQEIEYINLNNRFPYSVKKHLNINSWLWYHPLADPTHYLPPSSSNTDCLTHPCVKVDFLNNAAKWGGVNSTTNSKFDTQNRTTNIKSVNVDTNASKSQVKKLNW